MRKHLNTLFITLEGAYLRRDGAAVEVRHNRETKLRVPLHNLDGIVCFGWDTTASTALMAACAEADVSLSFHTPHGKFVASTQSFTSGNILLRRTQYRHADDPSLSATIARNLILGKLSNCRTILQRGVRDHGEKCPGKSAKLIAASDKLAHRLRQLQQSTTLEEIRGIEGEAAVFYFDAFNALFTETNPALELTGRSRRPPLDPINALLSFCYTLLMHDCRSALESAGLDSQCGFLHRDRPGRPSLALDLMEEFRPVMADRSVLTLINRKQVTANDFETKESGAVLLKEDSRKKILMFWQERKQSEIMHPFLQEKTTLGMLPHLQARLLCRYLRGDLDAYPAFLLK